MITLSVIFNIIATDGKALTPAGQKNQTCPKKQVLKIKNLCSNVNRDMQALFKMVHRKANVGQTQKSTGKNPFGTFSTVNKLAKDKIIERLYNMHNKLAIGYGLFSQNETCEKMKTKTIVIQIKSLAEILQNNTNCNPGKPGNEFKFDLPNDKPFTGTSSAFLYRFAEFLMKEMKPEFDNVVKQLNFI